MKYTKGHITSKLEARLLFIFSDVLYLYKVSCFKFYRVDMKHYHLKFDLEL